MAAAATATAVSYQRMPSSLLMSNSQVFNQSLTSTLNDGHSNSFEKPLYLFVFIAEWFILIITIVFGTIGNLLVLYVYMNRKDNKTCTLFIKMLAIIDLIICLILAPLELYQTTTGITNEFLCKVYSFLATHVLYSTFLITMIAFDRYFCICWPLYKIITIRRAHIIVVLCGFISSSLAIIPMSHYSTKDHIFTVHDNHSDQLPIEIPSDHDRVVYTHAEHLPTEDLSLSHTLLNATQVICSPRFSLHLQLPRFLTAYRTFHCAIFAVCMLLVLVLYAFIYNAVYQRRVSRSRKFSAYRRIIRSYILNGNSENTGILSKNKRVDHHIIHQHRPSIMTLICCYCCKNQDDYVHELQRPSEPSFHQPLYNRRQFQHHHHHDEPSSINVNSHHNKPRQVVLEVNGARGKRYSAISMTSMTYLTSGVWDDTSPTSLIRSRINSIAATTYCGTEHSSTSRPSVSTEDSFEQQVSKLLTPNSTQTRPLTPSTSSHLTVPGQQQSIAQLSPPCDVSITIINEEGQQSDNTLPRSISQCANLLQPTSIVRKTSNALTARQQQRPSDASVHQRKVSFMTSGLASNRCISEDPPSGVHVQTNLVSPPSPTAIHHQHQLTVHQQSSHYSSIGSIDHHSNSSPTIRNFSISSARRPSTFDCETQRVLERQQTQERLANIRTTFTLFIVTATFILMYLPSIIITLFNVKPNTFRDLLFLLFYINSACNPLIYSFFNVNFRNDIRRIYECQKREYLARQC